MILLTKKEAADILKVCPTTIRRMMNRGDLEGFRVGKITRITRKSLEKLIGLAIEPSSESGSLESKPS